MKLLLVLGFVCIIQCSWAATPADGVVASMDTGMNQGVSAYEDFLADTANATCSRCGCRGCCPVIVRNCPPKWVGSVIQPYAGWMGNAAIIIDWGCTEYNPCGCCPKGRLCTVNDKGFTWYINWGDGSSTRGSRYDLGPFQETHQYAKTCQSRTYGVTVFYCHNPGCSSERCCDSLYRTIDVSEDPQKGLAGVDFNKPLKDL